MPSESTRIALAFHAWIPVLLVILAAAALWAYYRTTPPVAGRLRWLLVGLRAAAFLLIVLVLMDPRTVHHGRRSEAPRVVTLVDHSASMRLPESGWSPNDTTRFDAARRLAREVNARLDKRGARATVAWFSKGVDFSAGDTVHANGQGTDIRGALREVSRRMEGEHLAAVVLLSDGDDTEDPLIREAVPDVPVFAVGLGDTTPPEDVRISDVDYNTVVRVPSRTTIAATLTYTGDRPRRVKVRLTEGNRRVFERDTVLTPSAREVVQRIPVRFTKPGRREFQLAVDVEGHDAQPQNNRRDIVIEAEKAKAKLVIVDMYPDWELHFLTDFLRRDQTFDFEVVTMPGRRTATVGKLRKPDEFITALHDCDAVVLGSLSPGFVDDSVARAIESFVRDRGGGLLVLPGRKSLFENDGAWKRLADILPLRGRPPFHFNIQYTSVIPGDQAATNPITTQLLPLFSQKEWQERSPLLGYYAAVAAKPVSEVLLSVRGRSVPAVTYSTVGKGRVVVASAGPLWRWKFLSDDTGVYDEMVSRILDVLSRGEQSDRFALTAKKNVFDAGESPVLYAEIFNEKMQPVTAVPVKLEVVRVGDGGQETPLEMVPMEREGPQSTRFRSEVRPLPPGRYVMRGHAELPDRPITSRPLEIRVSKTSVEFQRVAQNAATLAAIAHRTRGRYVPAAGALAAADRIPLSPRVVATVSELKLRTSAIAFLLILGLLSVEWLVRKRTGMI